MGPARAVFYPTHRDKAAVNGAPRRCVGHPPEGIKGVGGPAAKKRGRMGHAAHDAESIAFASATIASASAGAFSDFPKYSEA